MVKNNKILVADDEPSIRKLLSSVFENDCEVIEAEDGSTVQHLAVTNQPDIIFLDVMMPKMDGYEVLSSLKQNPETQNIPVIMLTALDSHLNQLFSLELGAAEHLNKPLDIKAVKTLVKKYLNRL